MNGTTASRTRLIVLVSLSKHDQMLYDDENFVGVVSFCVCQCLLRLDSVRSSDDQSCPEQGRSVRGDATTFAQGLEYL